jgi:MFS family permease
VTTASSPPPAPPSPTAVAINPVLLAASGALALAVAMGIGRFAFTPLLPLMLRDGVVDLQQGGWLATSNYVGYTVGAIACMAVPRRFAGLFAIKAGLVATVLLSLGMALPLPALWPVLRGAAGIASATVLVFSSGWCLAMLAALGRPSLGAAIFTGPGLGVVVSGLAVTAMVAGHATAETGWAVMGVLALVLTAIAWPALKGEPPSSRTQPVSGASAPVVAPRRAAVLEMAILTFAYGTAGFGYIVTATFLPVIARTALTGDTIWLDLFWPVLGAGGAIGSLLALATPRRIDNRSALFVSFICQAVGVPLALIWPSVPGFVASSFMVGLPLTAISFFAMQEVRLLRPHDAPRFMGLLTASFGVGQMAGPPVTTILLAHTSSHAAGFALGLGVATAGLVLGALLCGLLRLAWPKGI